ncbi:hypothetical protein K474DRAFT_1596083 [Panus rudis PR-1116 ss-1]|nr:hypothetical protein K474DRAFT_1596083 [Panus rudis PR-1116 ss-1]
MTTQAHPVAVKWSRGKHAIEVLSKEVRLYATALAELQGSVVPRCYGYFEETIDGVDIGCLVLERCGKTLTCATDMEMNRKIMLAVSKLHCAGIYHGDIYDGRHLLLAPDRTVRIIDFSKARVHECTNTVPYLFNEGTGEVSAGCQELEDMESFFGMYSGSWNATKRKPPTRRLRFAPKPNNVTMNGPA